MWDLSSTWLRANGDRSKVKAPTPETKQTNPNRILVQFVVLFLLNSPLSGFSPWPGSLHLPCASVFPSGFSPRQCKTVQDSARQCKTVQCSVEVSTGVNNGVKCGCTFGISLSCGQDLFAEEEAGIIDHQHSTIKTMYRSYSAMVIVSHHCIQM